MFLHTRPPSRKTSYHSRTMKQVTHDLQIYGIEFMRTTKQHAQCVADLHQEDVKSSHAKCNVELLRQK